MGWNVGHNTIVQLQRRVKEENDLEKDVGVFKPSLYSALS